MRLSDTVSGLTDAELTHQLHGDADIVDVVHSHHAVTPGSLFCCVPGRRVDGHDLAGRAVDAGAVALLVERVLDIDVPQVLVPSVREAMGPLAARFWGDPSRAMTVLGVTGTNGKTTTVSLLRSIMEAAGRRCEIIGTLSSSPGGPPTTPDAPELQAQLARWHAEGVDVVAMEVSSHALAMHRVRGTWFTVAGFTNLGHDHLDLHGSVEEYFETKAELFTPTYTDRAVVSSDDRWGSALAQRIEALADGGIEARTYSLGDVTDRTATTTGSRFGLRGHDIDLPLPGAYNVANALCAATMADWVGIDPATVAGGLSAMTTVPGRFEKVTEGQAFTVAVDYAHTPDALHAVLTAARELVQPSGRLVVVFGCGGDKDRAKRPEMGRVAASLADIVVITSDNPRTEDPDAILDEIVTGIDEIVGAGSTSDGVVVAGTPAPRGGGDPVVSRIVDRAAAIHHAVHEARDDDVVVIAGKGHETTQDFGRTVIDFDDRAVAATALRGVLGGGASAP